MSLHFEPIPEDEMKVPIKDLSHAVLHEVKNKLVVLNELLSTIPSTENPEHDTPLSRAQSLCQQISGEAIQILILYGAEVSGQMYLNLADLHSPQEFVTELAQTAISLSNKRLSVRANADENVPSEWYFDRNLLNLAVMNAVHNCLKYANE